MILFAFIAVCLGLPAQAEKENKKDFDPSFVVNNLSVSEIVERIVEKTSKPYKVKEQNASMGFLLLSRGVSFTSWGAEFPIIVHKISDSQCIVRVDFEKKVRKQLTGNGQYPKCVEYLKRMFDE